MRENFATPTCMHGHGHTSQSCKKIAILDQKDQDLLLILIFCMIYINLLIFKINLDL